MRLVVLFWEVSWLGRLEHSSDLNLVLQWVQMREFGARRRSVLPRWV